jgi:hypothetical protein
MDGEWLNRAGIILNFLAGFMLAPELLGLHRLREFEAYLEQMVTTQKSYFDRLTPKIGSLVREKGVFGFIDMFMTGFLFIILIFFMQEIGASYLGHIINLLAVFLYLLTAITSRMQGFSLDHKRNIFRQRLNQVSLTARSVRQQPINLLNPVLYLLVVMIAPIFLPVVWVLSNIFHALLSLLVKTLEGEEKMRSFLVSSGIIFFIVGNALQLWATFSTSK